MPKNPQAASVPPSKTCILKSWTANKWQTRERDGGAFWDYGRSTGHNSLLFVVDDDSFSRGLLSRSFCGCQNYDFLVWDEHMRHDMESLWY